MTGHTHIDLNKIASQMKRRFLQAAWHETREQHHAVHYMSHAIQLSCRLPENVSYEGGAIAEPLSNGIQACRRGQVAASQIHSFISLSAARMMLLCHACKAWGCCANCSSSADFATSLPCI